MQASGESLGCQARNVYFVPRLGLVPGKNNGSSLLSSLQNGVGNISYDLAVRYCVELEDTDN